MCEGPCLWKHCTMPAAACYVSGYRDWEGIAVLVDSILSALSIADLCLWQGGTGYGDAAGCRTRQISFCALC